MSRTRDFVHQLNGAQSWGFGRSDSLARRWHIDMGLLLALLMATAYGLLVLYSANGRSLSGIERQGTFFLLGYAALFVVAQIRLDWIARLAPWGYALGLLLLLLVPFIGVGAKGAQRWLDIPGLPQFQPSEIMKLMVPLCVSWYLGSRPLPPGFKHVIVSCALILVPVVLVMKQPDLGTALLILASGLFVLLLAGLSWWYVSVVALIGLIMAPIAWLYLLYDYQKRRILTLFNPEEDRLGHGWNIIQSKTAIGSGGIQGKGWLEGTQSHLDFLPESHTDFIIAVLAEEFGLIGVLCLLLIYLMIIGRGFHIGLRSQSSFGRLVAGSMSLTFFVYVFVNMGMVSGILPVVGVPLPLVTQGGTALITILVSFGLLMAVATSKRRLLAG